MKEYKIEMFIQKQVVKRIGHVSDRVLGGMEIGTAEQWDSWQKKAWNECKWWMVLDFIVSEIGHYIDSICSFVYYSPKCYLVNRFIKRSHIIRTSLPVGRHSDMRDRLFVGIMDECKRWVEVYHPEYKELLEGKSNVGLCVTGNEYCEDEVYRRDLEKRLNDIKPVLLAYYWYRDVYPEYKCKVDELYGMIVLQGRDEEVNKRNRAIYSQISELERQIEIEKITHCQRVIGCMDYLFDD
jgi:hypothetical protein